jgi:hypothetical protein
MIKAKGNSGGEKAPQPKSVPMFKGIKGLVASGPGMTKKVDLKKIRPEGKVSIDPGNVKAASGMPSRPAAGSPKNLSGGSGGASVMPQIRPEGPIKRDACGVVKP